MEMSSISRSSHQICVSLRSMISILNDKNLSQSLIISVPDMRRQRVEKVNRKFQNIEQFTELKNTVKLFAKLRLISKPIALITGRRGFEMSGNQSTALSKKEAKNIILNAKDQSNLTFEQIAQQLNQNKVWLTSTIYGEQPMDEELAHSLLKLIGIEGSKQLVATLKRIPEIRGEDHQNYATDPLVIRLYEVIRVYGPALKALIGEMCGNGIISAIDCKIDCDKYKDNETGDERVVLKIDGKFLKYKH